MPWSGSFTKKYHVKIIKLCCECYEERRRVCRKRFTETVREERTGCMEKKRWEDSHGWEGGWVNKRNRKLHHWDPIHCPDSSEILMGVKKLRLMSSSIFVEPFSLAFFWRSWLLKHSWKTQCRHFLYGVIELFRFVEFEN